MHNKFNSDSTLDVLDLKIILIDENTNYVIEQPHKCFFKKGEIYEGWSDYVNFWDGQQMNQKGKVHI